MDESKIIEAFHEATTEIWNDDDYFDIGYNNGLEAGLNIVIDMLKDQPEIVRCKDCKFGQRYIGMNGADLVNCGDDISHEADWYCADGER